MRKYVIDDASHAEPVGEYGSLAQAVSELRRLANVPWDQPPNIAPCTGWETCGRCYEIVEYEASKLPWVEIRRTPAFEVSAKGVAWSATFESDVANPASP